MAAGQRLSWVAGGDSRPSRRLSSSSKAEEERRCALRRRDREANGLALQASLHERAWGDERHLMQQELRSLKQNIFLFYVKLRWLLKHWRQGRQVEDDAEDFMEVVRPREFLCMGFVLDPQALLSAYPPRSARSHVMTISGYFSSPVQAEQRQWGCPVLPRELI